MHYPFAKSLLITVLAGLALAHSARAMTIRDDTPDSSYIALGAQSTYQAAGAFSGGSFGGTLISDPLASTSMFSRPHISSGESNRARDHDLSCRRK